MRLMLRRLGRFGRPVSFRPSGSAVLIGAGLGVMLLASVAAATPGAKSDGDAFPGRNGELVFAVTNRSSYYPDLYLMHSDGTGLRRITSRGGYTPAWSPDGKWIAFASNRSRPRDENASEIYVMRANGTELRRVTRNRFADWKPAWAPDGKRLIFQTDGGRGIALINVNGTGFRRLTDEFEAVPAWSPEGKTIAFALGTSRGGDTATYGIWLMNPDGSNQRQLTFPPHRSEEGSPFGTDSMPTWSPDGKQIAFTRSYRDRNDIYTVRVDGSGLRRLTNKVGRHYEATWSPNGRRIVFVTALYQRRVIDVMNADGTQQRRLITGRGGYVDPDWQSLPRR